MKNVIEEFVTFISRGNVIDLAVGVIIGGAFTSVVNSLVNNVITPLISFLTGGTPEVGGLTLVLGGQELNFSAFIGDIISFLITALAVFAIIKAMNAAAELKELAAKKAGLAKEAEEKAENSHSGHHHGRVHDAAAVEAAEKLEAEQLARTEQAGRE